MRLPGGDGQHTFAVAKSSVLGLSAWVGKNDVNTGLSSMSAALQGSGMSEDEVPGEFGLGPWGVTSRVGDEEKVWGLGAGEYVGLVMDGKGCVTAEMVRVSEPLPLEVALTPMTESPVSGWSWPGDNMTCGEASVCSSGLGAVGSSSVMMSGWSCGRNEYYTSGLQFPHSEEGDWLCTMLASERGMWSWAENPPVCHGNDVSVVISVSGGVAPYEVSSWEYEGRYMSWWSVHSSVGTVTSDGDMSLALKPGVYTFTVTDANQHGWRRGFVVPDVAPLTLKEVSSRPSRCRGETSGALEVMVEGGVQPYSARVRRVGGGNHTCDSGPFRSDIIDFEPPEAASASVDVMVEEVVVKVPHLSACVYELEVTDSHGCSSTILIDIEEPPALQLSIDQVVAAGGGPRADGKVRVSWEGGMIPRQVMVEHMYPGQPVREYWDSLSFWSSTEGYLHAPEGHGEVAMTQALYEEFSSSHVSSSDNEGSVLVENIPGGVLRVRVVDAGGCGLEMSGEVEVLPPVGFRVGGEGEGGGQDLIVSPGGCVVYDVGEWSRWSACGWGCGSHFQASQHSAGPAAVRSAWEYEEGSVQGERDAMSGNITVASVAAAWDEYVNGFVWSAIGKCYDPSVGCALHDNGLALAPVVPPSSCGANAVRWRVRWPRAYRAVAGEKTIVTLPDGSTIVVDRYYGSDGGRKLDDKSAASHYLTTTNTVAYGPLNTSCWRAPEVEWETCSSLVMQGEVQGFREMKGAGTLCQGVWRRVWWSHYHRAQVYYWD